MNAPLDMTAFIAAKSDQLNADDLIGGPRTITIRKVAAGESAEQPINVYYDGDDNKPFRPCKTIRRVMVACWGRDANAYVGRSMRLYRDAEVMFGGMKVGGLRVSHMSHIDGEQTVVVMKTKGKKAPMKVSPLQQRANSPAADPPAAAETPSTDAGQSAGAASNEDDAKIAATRDWADKTLTLIDATDGPTELAELQHKRAAGLAKVRAVLPDLADQIDAAVSAKLAAFNGADGGEGE